MKPQHQADTVGITTGKNEAFTIMIGQVVKKAQLAYVWAVDQEEHNLQEIFYVHKSDFYGIASAKALSIAQNIRDAITANISSLAIVQLSEVELTALNDAISNFEHVVGLVGTVKAHKTAGTQGIEESIEPLMKSLELIDFMIINSYSESNHDMVNEYLLTRHIDKMPVHHRGISIHVFDSETKADLQGVTLSVGGIANISNIDGIIEILKTQTGSQMIELFMPGYESQKKKIKIEQGKINYLDIEMVKVSEG